jgi:hypothetical protein
MADPKDIAAQLSKFNAIEADQPWYTKQLPMEGRATFLPFRDTMEGSVFNKRELALPGLLAGAINAFTAPERARTGSDPTFNPTEEGANFALNTFGGGMATSKAIRNLAGQGGVDLGMSLYKTEGLPNKGADLIQNNAETFAQQLKNNGFEVTLDHSGSKAGPSSYLRIYDPETGRVINNIRMSGHSKGVKGSASVFNVATPEEMQHVMQTALDMRKQGLSEAMLAQRAENMLARNARNEAGKAKMIKNMEHRLRTGKSLSNTQQEYYNSTRKDLLQQEFDKLEK